MSNSHSNSILSLSKNTVITLDPDIPNFSSTKYNKFFWKFAHSFFYFFFAVFFLIDAIFVYINVYINEKKNECIEFLTKICLMIGSSFYFISSFIEWTHFRRGCIGASNLNSKIKSNIDKSCFASLLRAKVGTIYSLNVIVGIFFIGSSLLKFYIQENKNFCRWHYFSLFIGMFVMSIAEIFKVERISIKTTQYTYTRDTSNLMVELFSLLGSILYAIPFLVKSIENYNIFIFWIVGAGFFLISSFILIYRYFLSGFEDLNNSISSYISV